MNESIYHEASITIESNTEDEMSAIHRLDAVYVLIRLAKGEVREYGASESHDMAYLYEWNEEHKLLSPRLFDIDSVWTDEYICNFVNKIVTEDNQMLALETAKAIFTIEANLYLVKCSAEKLHEKYKEVEAT